MDRGALLNLGAKKTTESYSIRRLALAMGVALAGFLCSCGGGGGGSAPPAITVTVTPASTSVPAAGTRQFTAAVSGTSNTAVNWTVEDIAGGNSQIGTISGSGLYTAPDAIPFDNTLTVRATSQADSAKSGSSNITITDPPLELRPIVVMQSFGNFELTVNGSGFNAGSEVLFNGVAKPTNFVDAGRVVAQMSVGDIAQPGKFPVAVRTSGSTTGSVNFFVVPQIAPQDVVVIAGTETSLVDVAVANTAPPLISLFAVGFVDSAGFTGVSVGRGALADLFLVGDELVPGVFFIMGGAPEDVGVTQPIIADFSETTDNTPSVNVDIAVGPSATPGPHNILVTNPEGQIAVFVGGLRVQ